jgi:hypothetical protein
MTTTADALPDDISALRALILAERAERLAERAEREQFAERIANLERLNAKLEYIVADLRRAHFGRKSERITDDQLALALDELETAAAKAEAEAEKADPERKAASTRKRRASRDEKLDHLPHEEVVIEPESKTCPCCGGELHAIGEDVSKRLDKVPAKVRDRDAAAEVRLPVLREDRRRRGRRHHPGAGARAEGCRPRPSSPMSWCRSTPTTCRSTGNLRSWRARA